MAILRNTYGEASGGHECACEPARIIPTEYLPLLQNNGLRYCLKSALPKLQCIIKQFGTDVKVEIKVQSETFEEYERKKEEKVKKIESTKTEKPKDENPVVFGKEIKSGNFDKISRINETSGNVLLQGELFKKDIDARETRNGKYIVTFDITDYEGSITCKLFGIEKRII